MKKREWERNGNKCSPTRSTQNANVWDKLKATDASQCEHNQHEILTPKLKKKAIDAHQRGHNQHEMLTPMVKAIDDCQPRHNQQGMLTSGIKGKIQVFNNVDTINRRFSHLNKI